MRNPFLHAIAFLLLALLACTAAARAEPPQPADAASSAPPIATVTLQPVVPNGSGAAAPIDPGPGIRFEDLPSDIGVRVRVLTRNQRVHIGIIKRADARHVTLRVRQFGGSATYVLNRDQIERIDPA